MTQSAMIVDMSAALADDDTSLTVTDDTSTAVTFIIDFHLSTAGPKHSFSQS